MYYGTDDRTMSLYDFVGYLCTDVLQNPLVSGRIDTTSAEKIRLLKNIMDIATSGSGLNYRDAAALFGMDAAAMKLLYALKDSQNAAWKASPETVVSFLNEHQDDLSAMADAEMLSKIGLLQNIIDAVIADEKLDEARLAELTDTEADKAAQLFLLYTYKQSDTAGWKLSAEQFVGFLAKDVLTDPDMTDRFGEDERKQLTSTADIISAVLSGKAYTSKETAELFDGMAKDLDADSIDVLYLYHDANASPDNTRTMSIEELMNYLNDTLIYDDTFKTMLDAETIAEATAIPA